MNKWCIQIVCLAYWRPLHLCPQITFQKGDSWCVYTADQNAPLWPSKKSFIDNLIFPEVIIKTCLVTCQLASELVPLWLVFSKYCSRILGTVFACRVNNWLVPIFCSCSLTHICMSQNFFPFKADGAHCHLPQNFVSIKLAFKLSF